MTLTAHSETGQLKSVLLKKASDAFISETHIEQYWQNLNYTGGPSLTGALTEYKAFEDLFISRGIGVLYLPADNTVNMDSIYCRDASIATNAGMILCNMGKPARKNEPCAQKQIFEKSGIPILGEIIQPGSVEGGDVAWLDEYTLAVGHSYRTNTEGIRQLKNLLHPLGVSVITVPLPHYKGPSDVFHLMSIISPVAEDIAVVYSPLMPITTRNELLSHGYQFIEVPACEFETMGCNVLAIAPGECIMAEGNPQTQEALEKAGCRITVYRGTEISIKGGGGPTCLTRPLQRLL
ncbi:MAG TPA: arginine deiminase family protein [Chitinophagaceae bacterium]|nr:arginine deiminase family protein [Chitinophagaceae bacterium]